MNFLERNFTAAKNTRPSKLSLEGFVYQATRTVALLPESKEGFISPPPPQPHNSNLTSFSFWLSSWLSS
jgi:hypothetical protein